MLKKARLRPENIADWDIQKTIPIQISGVYLVLALAMILGYKITNENASVLEAETPGV